MLERVRKQPVALFLALVLTALSVTVLIHAVADVAAQASETKTLTRDLEPATVYGSQVSRLGGAPVDDLFL